MSGVVEEATEMNGVEETTEMNSVEETTEINVVEDSVDIIRVPGLNLPHVELVVEGVPVLFVIDTGCQMSTINRKQMDILGVDKSELRGDRTYPSLGLLALYVELKDRDL